MQDELQTISKFFNGASFETKLSEDVYWVPFDEEGKNKHSYDEIKSLTKMSPYEKQKKVNTIADAIVLFIVSDFDEKDDNIYIQEGNIKWEFHKPGDVAITSNCGCCASCCSWVTYLLANNFEEVGIIGIIRPIGGHAISYFYKEPWYYILDLNTLVSKYRNTICPQSGLRADFVKSSFITGILVKAKSIEAYVRFYRRYTQKKIEEHLFIRERLLYACPIGEKFEHYKKRHIYIPNDQNISIIEQEKKITKISYEYVNLGVPEPVWN